MIQKYMIKALLSSGKLLTISRMCTYSVCMEEQLVRQTERKDEYKEHTVQSNVPAPMVERTFRLLELLSAAEDGLTLSELARALHASKGSIHGLLRTLESSGVIEQGEERRFVLGPRIYDLAQAYIQSAGLRRFALPAMHRLATSTGETVCLGKIEQRGVRIIESVVDEEKVAALHIAAPRGMHVPLLAAATGACILASWPVEQREEYLETHSLPCFTEHSITDAQQFLRRAEEARHRGVSYDYEEYLDGVNAVAAPIYGIGGTLVALLWIVGFASRWSGAAVEQGAEHLQAEAASISQFAVSAKRMVE
jgi:IclR family acetate operon transcriptional repressor